MNTEHAIVDDRTGRILAVEQSWRAACAVRDDAERRGMVVHVRPYYAAEVTR